LRRASADASGPRLAPGVPNPISGYPKTPQFDALFAAAFAYGAAAAHRQSPLDRNALADKMLAYNKASELVQTARYISDLNVRAGRFTADKQAARYTNKILDVVRGKPAPPRPP
jgi:hypothetical protein